MVKNIFGLSCYKIKLEHYKLFLYPLPSPLPRLICLHHHYTTTLRLLPCALNSTITDHEAATCAAVCDTILVRMLDNIHPRLLLLHRCATGRVTAVGFHCHHELLHPSHGFHKLLTPTILVTPPPLFFS